VLTLTTLLSVPLVLLGDGWPVVSQPAGANLPLCWLQRKLHTLSR
jgi:hypothetical protein